MTSKKTEAEVWLDEQSKKGSVMAESFMKLVENFHPDVRKHYLQMVYQAAQGAQVAAKQLQQEAMRGKDG